MHEKVIYRALNSACLEPLVIVGRSGDILFANEGAGEIFGFDKNAPVCETIDTIFLDSEQIKEILGFQAASGSLETHRQRLTRIRSKIGDGSIALFDLEIELLPGAPEALLLVVKGKESEPEVVAQLALMTLDAAASAMIMADTDGRIVFINNFAQTMFGYDAHELVGAPIETLIPKRLRADHAKLREEFSNNRSKREMGFGKILFGQHKSGRDFRVEVALTPVEYDGRKMVVATVVDLSERLEKERINAEHLALQQNAEKLRHLNEDLESVAYSASHDLKAPLSTIVGLVRLARMQLYQKEFGLLEEDLDRLEDVARRSVGKVERVLKLARHNPTQLDIEVIELHELILAVWSDLTSGLETPPELFVDIEHDGEFASYRDPLEIIFQNLLSNAIKFSDSEKNIRWISLSSRQDRGRINITIIDNGIGFPPQEAEKVFSLFSRLSPREGDGIGLALVRKQVQSLKGQICADSEPGKWARFMLSIPMLSLPDEKSSAITNASEGPAFSRSQPN